MFDYCPVCNFWDMIKSLILGFNWFIFVGSTEHLKVIKVVERYLYRGHKINNRIDAEVDMITKY